MVGRLLAAMPKALDAVPRAVSAVSEPIVPALGKWKKEDGQSG